MNFDDELPDDELVSAVLDDEAGEATRARVHDDPVLHARLTELRAVRHELRTFTVPDGLLDELRRTALDATAVAPPDTTAPVIPLDGARRARRVKAATWLGAAAAAIVLVAAIGFAGRDGGTDGDSATTASEAAPERATAASDAAGRADGGRSAAGAGTGSTGTATGAASSGSMSATSPPFAASDGASAAAGTDLGDAPDLAALAASYRARPLRGSGSSGATGSGATGSGAAAAPTTSAGCGIPLATGRLAGRPVQLVAAGSMIHVVDAETCALLGTITP